MKSTILIIEDDKDINEMLTSLLTNNGFNVENAYSGTEGLLVHSDNVDLILLDLMLPGKNGEEIIKELKEKNNVPVIVMSAIEDVNKKIDLFSLGANDYITKPFNILLSYTFIACIIISSLNFSIIPNHHISEAALNIIRESNPMRMYNSYDLGNELIYDGFDVFIDGRSDMYQNLVFDYSNKTFKESENDKSEKISIIEDYVNFAEYDYEDMDEFVNRYNFDLYVVLKNERSQLYLKQREDIELIYEDDTVLIFR